MRLHRPQLLGAAVAVVALLPGCGGGSNSPSSSHSPSSGGHATQAQAEQDLLNFARCMHSNGVPNFPDPNSHANFPPLTQQALGVSKRTAVAAKHVCEHLLPPSFLGGPQETAQQMHARLAAGLSFANCMRARGVASFPDPNSQGSFPPLTQQASGVGIDLHQPALLQAALACAPVTHGLITRAAIERAVNGG